MADCGNIKLFANWLNYYKVFELVIVLSLEWRFHLMANGNLRGWKIAEVETMFFNWLKVLNFQLEFTRIFAKDHRIHCDFGLVFPFFTYELFWRRLVCWMLAKMSKRDSDGMSKHFVDAKHKRQKTKDATAPKTSNSL